MTVGAVTNKWGKMEKQQTICLSMIVRDESKVIRRCLESVKSFVDSWAILDTGSTDNTEAVIRETMGDMPGEIGHSRPLRPGTWFRKAERFDFAAHRNQALDLARTFGTDYILLIDADEELTVTNGSGARRLPGLTADRYVTTFRRVECGRVWHRSLLVNTAKPWEYRYPIHETLHCDEPATAEIVYGLEVKSYSDGARNGDQRAKYLRDADACRAAIKAEPSEPRHWFYLGQSYAGAGEFLKALRAYQKRVEIGGGWDEEVWYAQFQVGQLRLLLNHQWRDVLAEYLAAFALRPWRAEPLWAAGVLCGENGHAPLGEVYLRQACRMKAPPDSFLLDESVYSWRSADDLAGCLARMGRARECADLLKKLSEDEFLPPAELPRVLENIAKAESIAAEAA